MGADLYIRKISEPLREKFSPIFDAAIQKRHTFSQDSKEWKAAQKKVNEAYNKMFSKGYFRDSYNGTNVLNRLGLSYWTDFPKYTTTDGDLSGDNLQKLRDIIANAKLKPIIEKELKDSGCAVDNDKNSVEVWQKYFEKKHKELVRFMDTAIKLKTEIHCSC